MKIAVLKETKLHEYRVGLTPSCVKAYTTRGHRVFVETDAGAMAGFSNDEYTAAGAVIIADRESLFADCDMIVKVKEPTAEEVELFHPGQILYTYLHLAASKKLTCSLLEKKVKAVAYETIETDDHLLPCLKPMSEIAGRLAVQEGAKYLEKPFGGRGILLGGVPGIERGKIGILGGGVAGANACKMAVGIGAGVTILDINAARLGYLDDIFGTSITTLYSTEANIEKVLADSDVVIAAVLVHGAKAPRLIRADHLKTMKAGAVIVDISIDQGGCTETSRPTTHDDPVYVVDRIVHYCVSNMPGAVALSSTIALTSATLRYGLMIADKGLEQACAASSHIRRGVNLYQGKCVYENIAKDLGLKYHRLDTVME